MGQSRNLGWLLVLAVSAMAMHLIHPFQANDVILISTLVTIGNLPPLMTLSLK
jgi:hypothetical protein